MMRAPVEETQTPQFAFAGGLGEPSAWTALQRRVHSDIVPCAAPILDTSGVPRRRLPNELLHELAFCVSSSFLAKNDQSRLLLVSGPIGVYLRQCYSKMDKLLKMAAKPPYKNALGALLAGEQFDQSDEGTKNLVHIEYTNNDTKAEEIYLELIGKHLSKSVLQKDSSLHDAEVVMLLWSLVCKQPFDVNVLPKPILDAIKAKRMAIPKWSKLSKAKGHNVDKVWAQRLTGRYNYAVGQLRPDVLRAFYLEEVNCTVLESVYTWTKHMLGVVKEKVTKGEPLNLENDP